MRGIRVATDAEIIAAYQKGWFINQIRHTMNVGIARVRRVLDEEGLRERVPL